MTNEAERDRLMAMVPNSLPKEVDAWLIDTCLANRHYMFYAKPNYAYCTGCNKVIDQRLLTARTAKHNTKGTCPECGRKITYICFGVYRSDQVRTDYFRIRIMQPTLEGIVIRRYEIIRSCFKTKTGIEVKLAWFELQRQFNNGVKKKNYCHSNFYRQDSWYETKSINCGPEIHALAYLGTFEYTANINDCLHGCLAYAKKGQDLSYYAGWIRECEYLEKYNLKRLVEDIISGRRRGLKFKQCKNVQSFLGITKEELKQLEVYNLGLNGVWTIQQLHKYGLDNFAVKDVPDYERLPEIYRNAIKCYPIEFKDLAKYALREKAVTNSYSCYQDYLGFCRKLDYPGTDEVLFPKDLRHAHDREMKRVQYLVSEQKANAVVGRFKKDLNKFKFESEGMTIRPPKTAGEIIDEGQKLGHCVGSYVDGVAKKETTILFVRKADEPETPFYTVEWRDGVKQVRGKGNEVPTPEVKEFIEAWLQALKKRGRRLAKA